MARYGTVAQLGERDVRNVEVEGSIPFGSTILGCRPTARTWVFEAHDESSILSAPTNLIVFSSFFRDMWKAFLNLGNLLAFGLPTLGSLGFFIYALCVRATGPAGWQYLMLLVSVVFGFIWYRVIRIQSNKK
jgi:hypothetical protein